MGLETFTYITSFVSTNPTATDPKSQGDDHIRGLKAALLASFPNIAGAVTPTHTELNFVDGVTSAIQTQLNAKGAIAGQTWTGTHAFASTTSIGNVSATEISYLDGVTSAIQTQIDSKGAITGQTWTGTHVLPATTSIGNVSATEISYLDGVTSALQTQLDAKAPLASPPLTGTPTAPTAAPGTNTTQLATTEFVVAQGLISALPGQSLGFLRSDATTPAFTQTHTGYAQKEVKGADIASAATVNLSTATGNLVHITGTTGITAFTIDSGAEYTCVFDGVVTLTHSANIICPGGLSITTAANTALKIRGDGTNIARIVGVTGVATVQTSVSGSQLDKTSDTTLANIPNLSATLVAGGVYKFELLAYTTSVSSVGVKFNMGGGTATATSFVAVMVSGTASTITNRVTAIASNLSDSSNTRNMVTINGTVVCNAGGTFIPQFAQQNSDAQTSSVLANSTFTVERIS
jgi:hypothetical protein